MQPWREIVSDVVATRDGRQAWVEMDAAGHLSVRCTGCRLDEYRAGMAPALAALVDHAATCETAG
jgi:hypothetical protein